MSTRQLAVAAIRLVAIAGFVRFALPFFAGLGEFITSGWTFPADVNAETAVGTLAVAAVVWAIAPALAGGIVGNGELPDALTLDVGKLILLGFAITGLVICAGGIVTLGQDIVQSYTAAYQPGPGMAPPAAAQAGPIVGAAIQSVIGALIFLGRNTLGSAVQAARDL